ncbi:unnamed protein product, partial [Effrenium voratum]
ADNCPYAHSEEDLRSTDFFYKKRLCLWHQKGRCRNGEQCRFAHGNAELRAHTHMRQQKSVDALNAGSQSSHSQSSYSQDPGQSSASGSPWAEAGAFQKQEDSIQSVVRRIQAEVMQQQPPEPTQDLELQQKLLVLLQLKAQVEAAQKLEGQDLSGIDQFPPVPQVTHPALGPMPAVPLQATISSLSENLALLARQLNDLEHLARRQQMMPNPDVTGQLQELLLQQQQQQHSLLQQSRALAPDAMMRPFSDFGSLPSWSRDAASSGYRGA